MKIMLLHVSKAKTTPDKKMDSFTQAHEKNIIINADKLM
jgi:hypothetical protein